jgi:segregation and condensation protein B
MSLKAKLEAVIYAAEEPVTLAQFASLFAEEALAWKAERDAQLPLSLESANDPDAAAEPTGSIGELAELLEVLDVKTGQDAARLQAPEGLPESEPETTPVQTIQAVEATEATEAAEPVEATAPIEPIDPELEAKRAERKRDREVREILREILDELIAEYAQDSRGIEIREIAGGFRMGTKPEIHDAVRIFIKSLKPALKLSLPALETLAVIAYKQPVTAPEVGEIRGVDSAGVLGSLMSRKLIATAGRKQVIGRPMLYKTTKEFLLRFGLKDLNELPSMEEFEKMAALELDEESLDDESSESSGPVEQSGDLFAPGEQNSNDPAEPVSKPEAATETGEPDGEPPASNEVSEAVTIPTAETSEQAAEAHDALVERQNAEEVEVEQ